jgi:cell wall-associated NlpC family hydrolase
MAYQPYYGITNWEDLPSQKTAINRKNLLHAENGIKEADNRIVQLDANKADKSLVNTMVKDVSMDTTTGVLTVTLLNGTTKTYDLDIEKVVVNFDITDDDKLVLTLADGTQKVIDLTRFVYSVDSTSTISMQIQDRTITARIVDGSVTMEKLDAAIQTEFRQYMLETQAARDTAKQYQLFAKRYTLGDESFPGSETDNAKYYYEQAKTYAQSSGQNAQAAADSAAVATEQKTIATQKASAATAAANNTAADVLTTTTKAAAAAASEQVAKDKAAEAGASKTAAEQSAAEASDSALLAKRYSIGGVVPEDAEDNAEWYYQRTKNLKEQVDAVAKIAVPQFYIDFSTGKLMSDTEAKGMTFWIENGKFYGEETA